jgi:RHS repeat-associated protein
VEYLYGPNVGPAPLEQIGGGGHGFLVSDPTGVRELLSSSGSVSATTSYNSYGVSSNTPISAFGFEGGLTDPNGFIYLIGRYYDPATGQFLSVDPDVAGTGEPYTFAGSDPVNGSDPTGSFFMGDGGQTAGVAIDNSENSRIQTGEACFEDYVVGGPSGPASTPFDYLPGTAGSVTIPVRPTLVIPAGAEYAITISSSLTIQGTRSNSHYSVETDGSVDFSNAGASASFSSSGAITGTIGVPGSNGVSLSTNGGVSYASTQTDDIGGDQVTANITATFGTMDDIHLSPDTVIEGAGAVAGIGAVVYLVAKAACVVVFPEVAPACAAS